MKKIILFLWLIVSIVTSAQNQLEIHHVNIGNGDCTIIVLRDNNGIISKTIIDGGNSNYNQALLPYINQEFGGNTNFRYLILSHFHADHFNGLLVLKNGTIHPDMIIDGGGYVLNGMNVNAGLHPPNAGFPPPKPANKWINAVDDYGNNVNNNAVRAPQVTNLPPQIGGTIILGTINGINVTMTCIAANGWNVSNNGPVNNIINGRSNQNNYSVGWLLEYGRFRYYTAGDIGGYGANYNQNIPYNGGQLQVTGHCSPYTDQETTIAQGLAANLPAVQPVPVNGNNYNGHVCGVKISHHGSSCSNNTAFLGTLRPAAFFTSVGGNNRWKLPKLNTLYNMSQVQPLSNNANIAQGLFNQGFYFTNLYNFSGANNDSRTYAGACFNNRAGINFNYGNDNNNTTGSYMLLVPDQSAVAVSHFGVLRVNCPSGGGIQPHQFLAQYLCHQ